MTAVENKQRVFVYGSLKRGHQAHYKLMGQEFLGTAISPPFFQMKSGLSFPMLYLDNKGHSVRGEIFSVEKGVMVDLDQYENYPSFYNRTLIKAVFVEGDGTESFGDTSVAWIYYNKTASLTGMSELIKPNHEGQLVYHRKVT